MKTSPALARHLVAATCLTALCAGVAYGAGWVTYHDRLPWQPEQVAAGSRGPSGVSGPDGTAGAKQTTGSGGTPSDHGAATDAADPTPPADPTDGSGANGGDDPSTGGPADTPTDSSDPTDGSSSSPDPSDPSQQPATPTTPAAGAALLSPGDTGPEVRELQARLKQIDWFSGDVTDSYGSVTETAVRGFQAKREIAVTGEVDQRTLSLLEGMTTEPTKAELTNQPPPGNGGNVPGALDPRCAKGRVLCVDKSTRTLRWVVAGDVRKTVDVRFGSAELPTREGVFSISRKDRDHVSTLYHTSMPFAMFFSGGQAVHYSPDFAATGYNGASHGCVNVRDHNAVAWLYDQVAVGDKVVIYWS